MGLREFPIRPGVSVSSDIVFDCLRPMIEPLQIRG
jgi:hypothetical protein